MGTDLFESIQLSEMDQVKLMNRTDQKYWFHLMLLPEILQAAKQHYYILNINDERQMPYKTTYFDTVENKMFALHHNGKLNRFKIRKRTYVSSGISFLEIKFKSNKGRTIKNRLKTESVKAHFSAKETDFINSNTPYTMDDLSPTLTNEFTRITLVNRNIQERCTIDFNIHFNSKQQTTSLKNLAIIEIKSDRNSNASPLSLLLRDRRIKSSGFSKYCIGRAIMDQDLKKNAFKAKIRSLDKVLQSNEPFNLN